jgi:hypothetical protein
MTPDQWMVAAILLFIGATLFIDPEGAAKVPRGLMEGLRDLDVRTFRSKLQAKRELGEEHDVKLSPVRKSVVQLAGIAFIALGLAVVVVS